MNEAEKNELRQRLEVEMEASRKAIVRLEESSKPVAPDKALGRLTRMESLNDQGISGAALSQHRERLHKMEQAVAQIDRPGFGSCIACKQPIPHERLLALPESTLCVACAGRKR